MQIHFRHLKKGSYIKKEILNARLREIIRYETHTKGHDRDLKTVYTTENYYKRLNNAEKGTETDDTKKDQVLALVDFLFCTTTIKIKIKFFLKDAKYIGKV